ncbi:DUF5753 domain-containing protein [Micromonospora sp. NPDC049101]|uniref:DUF5753 domain-containing protein n=1 Tax=Micromonospora sp. NPDC049101 TaxID=3155032 RepID=UPI0033DACFD9
MTFGQGPMTNRRRLRVELRRLRESRELTLDDVRKKMEWSVSKLIRIESGVVSISLSDLKLLLHLYGVRDPQKVAGLLEVARRSRQHHWAGEYRDISSASYMDFLGYEDDAVRVTQYHPLVVPGLLQTEDYATEIVTATTIGPNEGGVIERLVKLRMARQQRFFEDGRNRRARFILPEPVLTPPMEPGIVAEQRKRLKALADKPHVEMRILPSHAEITRKLLGSFSLHEFESDVDPDIVYLGSIPALDVALVEDDRVNDYKAVLEELLESCLDEDDSRARLRSFAS